MFTTDTKISLNKIVYTLISALCVYIIYILFDKGPEVIISAFIAENWVSLILATVALVIFLTLQYQALSQVKKDIVSHHTHSQEKVDQQLSEGLKDASQSITENISAFKEEIKHESLKVTQHIGSMLIEYKAVRDRLFFSRSNFQAFEGQSNPRQIFAIHVFSNDLSNDLHSDEFLDLVINNLKKGIRYRYYIPTDKIATFSQRLTWLINEKNEGIALKAIDENIPYNTASEKAVVKFYPVVDWNFISEYVLFEYTTNFAGECRNTPGTCDKGYGYQEIRYNDDESHWFKLTSSATSLLYNRHRVISEKERPRMFCMHDE